MDSTTTSSIVTALGGGSGIDMIALANTLAKAQFEPRTTRLTAKSETLDKQISAASSLKGMLLGLASSLGERVRTGDLSPQPRLANSAVANASLSGGAVPSGTYSIEVTALASAQTLSSPAYTSGTAAVGSGTLTLRFGTVAGGAFSADAARTPVSITIPSGATLAATASAINTANAGVTAYIANTTDGARLVLKGKDGAASGFVLEATETLGEEGLSQLAWAPATGNAARLLGSAQNAALKIDGLPISSLSNNITDAVPGVALKLTATNSGAPTQLSFAEPGSALSTVMTDLTAALNELAAELRTATDPRTGDLARDSGALALKRTLSELAGTVVMPNAPGGAPRTLADLGLSTQRDGSFALDGNRLAATLKADPQAAAAMFTTGLFGVFGSIDGIARGANRSANPRSLAGSIARYTSQKGQIGSDQAKLAEAQEQIRAQLVSRFTAADQRVGASRSTLSFLQNQIAAWNAKSN